MKHNPRVLTIHNIEEAREALKKIGVDPGGIEIMASKAIHRLVKLEDVDVRAANILKQEMLSRGGEVAISKEVYFFKKDKTDLILMGTEKQFEELYPKLLKQPFGLPGIASEIKEVLSSLEEQIRILKIGRYEYDLSTRTLVMGILNVTPDSFSDGGKFLEYSAALSQAKKMVEEGVDIIDIGGESSRPGAEPVSLKEELARVIPVIESLAPEIERPISIDTYKAEVARQALDAGADMVNDISGLRMDEKMAQLVAERNVPVVIMHIQGTPRNMQDNPQYEDVVGEIIAFFRERIEVALEAGVKKERIIIDPGIGFGKTVEHNLQIMHSLSQFKSLGRPILLGTSRKSFIGAVLDLSVEERLEGTAATLAYGISQGADIIRVHDVKEAVRVARMTDAICKLKTKK